MLLAASANQAHLAMPESSFQRKFTAPVVRESQVRTYECQNAVFKSRVMAYES